MKICNWSKMKRIKIWMILLWVTASLHSALQFDAWSRNKRLLCAVELAVAAPGMQRAGPWSCHFCAGPASKIVNRLMPNNLKIYKSFQSVINHYICNGHDHWSMFLKRHWMVKERMWVCCIGLCSQYWRTMRKTWTII